MSDVKQWFERKNAEWGGIEGFTGGDVHDPTKPWDPPIPMTQEELSRIEADLEVTLPQDYRSFLLEVGGCALNGVYVRTLKKCHGDDTQVVSLLYGAAASSDFRLSDWIQMFKGRIPGVLIPVGDDGFGNQYCLGIAGDRFGKVYFWDHEDERDPESYRGLFGRKKTPPEKWLFGNVTLVAESFLAFLNAMEAEEDS